MTRDELRAALSHVNVQAFLRVIREGESGQDDNAYRIMYGGGYFASFADHPRQKNTAAGITSSAAGAYQFLEKTWDGLVAKYGFPDFSPASQDEAAVALIHGRGALQDLLRGDLSEVLDKCSYEWASLPPGRYGQPTLDPKRVYATFDKWLAPTAVPTHVAVPENKPMAPFIAAALPSILAAVPDLLKIFKNREDKSSDQYAQAAEKVVQIAVQATNASNVQAAVEKIASDPGAAEAVRAAVRERWYELVQSSEENIAAARKFATEYGKDRTVIGRLTFIEALSLVFVGVSSTGGGWVLYSDFPPEMKGAVITLMLIAGFTGVKEFWFGSSRGSDRKTEMLNER